jgi:thiosulfate dehydrogenase [quinone] large subunit
MKTPLELLGNPAKIAKPRALAWLQQSRVMAVGWSAMRIWLGVMWLQAGIAKLWGSESSGFMHGGAAVAGFASGTGAYSWWTSVMHGFFVPNAGWIAVLVAVGEFAIGCSLALGLLTPISAFASLILLFTYVMSGTASVCGFYALIAVVLLVMWRSAGYIGVDGLLYGYRQRRDAQLHATDDHHDLPAVLAIIPDTVPEAFTADRHTTEKVATVADPADRDKN